VFVHCLVRLRAKLLGRHICRTEESDVHEGQEGKPILYTAGSTEEDSCEEHMLGIASV